MQQPHRNWWESPAVAITNFYVGISGLLVGVAGLVLALVAAVRVPTGLPVGGATPGIAAGGATAVPTSIGTPIEGFTPPPTPTAIPTPSASPTTSALAGTGGGADYRISLIIAGISLTIIVVAMIVTWNAWRLQRRLLS